MNFGRLLKATLIVGVVVNVVDYLMHGLVLAGSYAEMDIMRQDVSMVALVVGDFVAALVFVWVYDKVRGSFAQGMGGGLMFGLYAGVLVSFPAFIFDNLLLAGFSYGLAWTWIITSIIWCLVAGATTGAIYGSGDEATA